MIDMSMGNPDGATPPHIVAKLLDVAQRPDTHGYSTSKGIPRLRRAISHWYRERYAAAIDPDTEAVVTIGSKEGLAHLMLATLDRGDTVLVPDPSYPIHIYGAVIAGADIRSVPVSPEIDFFAELERAIRCSDRKPKMIVLGFPSNPTAQCVELAFFERVIALARQHDILVVHDLAYADIVFDGWKAPSIMQVPEPRRSRWNSSPCPRVTTWQAGASVSSSATVNSSMRWHGSRAITITELSLRCKWRPLLRSKGTSNACRISPRSTKAGAMCWSKGSTRRDGPCTSRKPRCTSGRRIPERYRPLGSLEFSKRLLAEAKVSVSPGIGFGDYGDGHVRFALIENENRIRQAMGNQSDVAPVARFEHRPGGLAPALE